ncbi:hypothetical protein Sbal175_4439 (plasmid) [Shewanella baltica BA175]|nr:hypothetical protein Sbal175_4439 [Shewanella baltica BA175]
MDIEQFELIKTAELCCRDIIINLSIHDELNVVQERAETTDDDILFNSYWAQTRNNSVFVSILRWCQIFGAHKESTHWKNIQSLSQSTVRSNLCGACGISEDDWMQYHKIALSFRNKLVAHVDIGEVLRNPAKTHYLKVYHESAKALRNILISLLLDFIHKEPLAIDYVKSTSQLTNQELERQARRMAALALI